MRSVRRKKIHTLFFNNSKVKVRFMTLLFSLLVLVFGLAVLSDTAGYGLGKGAGALAGAILGSETTDNYGMKPFLVIYGGYVGANTAGGILGDKLSTEIKNKIAVSDKEKMEKWYG